MVKALVYEAQGGVDRFPAIELYVNWKPAWFSFSVFWVELLNSKGWVVYQIEAFRKLYLVYKYQDFK